jgi:hypothetical protein
MLTNAPGISIFQIKKQAGEALPKPFVSNTRALGPRFQSCLHNPSGSPSYVLEIQTSREQMNVLG